jgi:energy-coupling factor transport system permease protein
MAAGVITLAVFCIGVKPLVKSLRFLLPLGFIFGIINPLLVRRGATILFYLFGNPVTWESAAFGFNHSLLIISMIILFMPFNKIIDQPAFLYLTARYMPRMALLISMTLNSAARLRARAVSLIDVQKTRGLIFDGQRVKKALWLLNLFTVRNLEEGMEMAVVLKARDYGMAKRTAYQSYIFGTRDILFLITLVFLLFLGFLGANSYNFYPRLDSLNLTYFYIPYLVFIFIPVISDMLWKRHGN